MTYAELHCKSNFSFLQGASHADELVRRAAELGYGALAVTDHNSLSGVVRAHAAAKEMDLPLIVGAELTCVDLPPVVLWAPDRTAYGRLSRLITVGRRRAPKGECQLTFADLAQHQTGLLAGIPLAAWESNRPAPTTLCQDLVRQRELWGDRCYLLAELHGGEDDAGLLARWRDLSRQVNMPLVAAGDVHYHLPARMVLQDVLTAIRLGTTVDQLAADRFPNAQRYLRSVEELLAIYQQDPKIVGRSMEIAQRCDFCLDQLRYEYPEELAPDGQSPVDYLTQLTWQGAQRRYPHEIPDKVRRLLHHELALIQELHYEAYFLTVWDLVRFARERGILCQGRGSAANSAVCYCLEITAVDPDQTDVLFERFISRERNEAPDIDVDFEHERREEVLQYLYDKYGRERAGIAAEVITYRARSAVRDVGKALSLSAECVDALAKQVDGYHPESSLADRCREVGLDPQSAIGQRLVYVVQELMGFPRHLSQHVGGMVMTGGPLCELVPIENAAMEGRTVIGWAKDDLEELGILKVDCLALGMLTAIRRCFQLIEQHQGTSWTLAGIPVEDSRVYDMICQADTMGVFQIESRAQMSMLPRLRPRCFYDLVIEVAIVRPGPIQGEMVHPYLRRRAGKEPVTYANADIARVLEKTLGVPIFQEQAMRLAVVAAGFTPGEADQLRRAMGAWRRPGVIDAFRRKLIQGMLARGLSRTFAEQIFQQMRGFGEYGFPESHAASFALLVYVSAWLKCYYPAHFVAALLNSQPMGFYAPAQLVRDAQAHGVMVRPVDVNASDWDCTLEPAPHTEHGWDLRLGFRLLVGVSERHIQKIMAARRQGPYVSIADLTRRTGLSRAVLQRLARADALTSLQAQTAHRRQALWNALAQEENPKWTPLLQGLEDDDENDGLLCLPALDPQQEVLQDYKTMGLSLRAHPISFHRKILEHIHVTPAGQLAHLTPNQVVYVAGLVLLRQRPSTAKGITFVTLEDETGTVNLIVRPAVWERFAKVSRRSPAWLASGQLQHQEKVIHVVVEQLADLGTVLSANQEFA